MVRNECDYIGGVKIGDNVIIGLNSVVTKDIPSNSVAVGSPAKVICTMDEYYEKRKALYVNECIEYAKCIKERGNKLNKEIFFDDFPAFVDGHNVDDYNYPYSRIFSDEQFSEWKKHHKARFNGWSDFLDKLK